MPTPTPVLGLQAAVPTDVEPTYLTTALAGSLTTIDGRFAADATGLITVVDPYTQPVLAATPTVLPPAGSMRLYPKADGQYYRLDEAGLEVPFAAAGCIHEEFLPAAAATSITLAMVPQSISSVARDGLVQSAADGHYAPAGQSIGFATPFTGTERVVVEYSLQTDVPPPPFNGGGLEDNSVDASKLVDPYTAPQIATPTIFPPVGSSRFYPKADGHFYKIDSTGAETPLGFPNTTTYGREEFLPAAGETAVTLAQSAVMILIAARGGVVQSETDGNYTLAGADLTFADPFTGTERVVVAYTWVAP